ncbi:hypothetical protein [Pantoea allii]|uniref:hypothetical protein n=1 Tax=Pantoea allii TaxID=574096 RepID=UPI0024B7C4D0|nr:hypothetical protein [Pantoea allii]MDJ0090203.1 hypothetical protein [Pantoea allii]
MSEIIKAGVFGRRLLCDVEMARCGYCLATHELTNHDGEQDNDDRDSNHLNKNLVERKFTHSATSLRQNLPNTQHHDGEAD